MPKLRRLSLFAALALLGVAAYFGYRHFRPGDLPEGFVRSNGRIEAVEIDVAAKTAGRIAEIAVDEGDFIEAGQKLATMDVATLRAQLREAEANLEQAKIGVDTAEAEVRQQEAQRDAANALVAQRQAELGALDKDLDRTRQLLQRGTTSQQQLDQGTAAVESGKAALGAARAQVAAADAAISHARSSVVAVRAQIAAAEATKERIEADIADSTLRSPRSGRIQYRVAQPGEVVGAGGAVLNLVDLTDVFMTFFLPTEAAGRVAVGSEVRIVLDAAPEYVVPARVTYVADVAQFTPKTVETEEERQKLSFRVKAGVDRDVLERYVQYVKTGLPGVAHVRLDQTRDWPENLAVRLPDE
ncbi:HlyD family secretion protein [Jiella avicenniae]|uniref:HlyD family efflux transporter periplasmic adaptor subunit n=1 Tax=Jiella avicenniae TaxID=2907202 RepID=A0A9X1P3A6_9HYPH|nr:HlyD family efflux transporter periplasmic adaptor subunit [Jiella avicenniae]MCE7030592.1 HlyD family efflux transporter periplasmic adaptor subunit [Jiella avicenniae]